MFLFKKPSKEELAERPLDKNGRKEGRALSKGVRKFLRYNDDLIDGAKKEEILAKNVAFLAGIEDPTKKRRELEVMAEELTETCKKSVKDYKPSAWKENIEVIFVAVVIAMGIRAYFIQQFKIPTGSMQPTLNGIIAYPTKEMNPLAERHAPTTTRARPCRSVSGTKSGMAAVMSSGSPRRMTSSSPTPGTSTRRPISSSFLARI